ncbi:dTDP-4-dehydrorhamnose reductase family protein [Pseudoalteromonas rubra]|uniref:dTDP-4-dehydrorhamnose reductase family protein n=1 Tax=Pseudoalteromonas rubra TaxID=43658 RepID=UPI000F78DDC1|nr:SDR family oxidoreductase [Pseudoalteromonas rubra]
MKVLVIGATGMLGYSIFSNLSESAALEVYGTVRSIEGKQHFFERYLDSLIFNVDICNFETVEEAVKRLNPDVVVNCIGIIKQQKSSNNHLDAIYINALLPHKLANLCDEVGSKLIHFSTDCVFSGEKGMYGESDTPDASDLYGKSKLLGEVDYSPHLTLRTSIIGHELGSSLSLVDWFLSQTGAVNGYAKAIFSGLPTCYVANLLAEYVLPRKDLSGLFHLSVDPIDKFTLLKLVKDFYASTVTINEYKDFHIDRSLDSSRLRKELDWTPPQWVDLIELMHTDFCKRYKK